MNHKAEENAIGSNSRRLKLQVESRRNAVWCWVDKRNFQVSD